MQSKSSEFLLFTLLAYILYMLVTSQHTSLKPFGCCMVKPLGQLVQVSLTPYNASTSCLSTSSSITTLPDFKSQG